MGRKPSYRDILLRATCPNSRTNLRGGASQHREHDPKDDEIRTLQMKLAQYETQASKNDNGRRAKEPPNTSPAPDNKTMMDFISTTMKALEEFKKQLAN